MTKDEFRALRRGRLNMTQLELAMELCLSTRQISNYENGTSPIPRAIAIAINAIADVKKPIPRYS